MSAPTKPFVSLQGEFDGFVQTIFVGGLDRGSEQYTAMESAFWAGVVTIMRALSEGPDDDAYTLAQADDIQRQIKVHRDKIAARALAALQRQKPIH